MKDEYVIEFRSGTFFQNLEADHGGPRETAQRFASEKEADDFMREHEWIAFGGGMALPAVPDKVVGRPIESCYRGEIIEAMRTSTPIELPLLNGRWIVSRLDDKGGTVLVWARRAKAEAPCSP